MLNLARAFLLVLVILTVVSIALHGVPPDTRFAEHTDTARDIKAECEAYWQEPCAFDTRHLVYEPLSEIEADAQFYGN